MRNGTKHKMMPLLSPFTTCAVTFVLPDEMADVSIAGLQWFILISRLNHMGSHGPNDSHSIPYLHQEKNIGFGTRTTQPAAILRITGKKPFISDFSRLLRHAIEKGRGPILYSKKPRDPLGIRRVSK